MKNNGKEKCFNKSKMDHYKNKEKVAEKIDSLWSEKTSSHSKPKLETKKVLIKLERKGSEKRKFTLKMDSESPISYSNNYNLISELLREFFNSSSNLE